MAAKKRPGRQHKSVRKSSRRRETGLSLANGGVAKQTAAEFSCDKCRLVVTVSIGIRHFYPGDVYPGSDFFPSRIPDPTFFHPGSRIRIFHPGSTSKNLSILTQKIVFFKLSEIWSGLFIPDLGSGSWFFTHPGSRIQGLKGHRIPDPDPQQCFYLFLHSYNVKDSSTIPANEYKYLPSARFIFRVLILFRKISWLIACNEIPCLCSYICWFFCLGGGGGGWGF